MRSKACASTGSATPSAFAILAASVVTAMVKAAVRCAGVRSVSLSRPRRVHTAASASCNEPTFSNPSAFDMAFHGMPNP